jgi:hypothetical protein
LLSQLLPAATFPTQIVLANRYITGGGDPNQIDQQPWDASVQAVAHYPPLLQWMSDNLSVTTALGQAFLNQQAEVMASIQRLRTTAYNLGNLQSTPQQEVADNNGDIEIDPANPQDVYVPSYQPDQVYTENPNGTPFITFGVGYPIGLWLNHDFYWGNDELIVWSHTHPRPANWWREPAIRRNINQAAVWHPSYNANSAAAQRGDRGWNTTSTATRVETSRPIPQQSEHVNTVSRSAPTVSPHTESSRPQTNGALIGIESSHATRTYSARGQQSLHAASHSASASRPPSAGGSPIR